MSESNKKLVVRIVAIALVVLLVLGVASVGMSVFASDILPEENTVLPKHEIYFTDRTIREGYSFEVPKNGVLLVEKGVTLTIHGTLTVNGTLKNEGTILITNGSTQKDREEEITFGTLINNNTIENKGKIWALNGNITNKPLAELKNESTILLSNNRETGTLLNNMYREEKGTARIGKIVNNGTITVKNDDKAVGISSMKGAVITNNGKIEKTATSTIKGTVSGNKVVGIIK